MEEKEDNEVTTVHSEVPMTPALSRICTIASNLAEKVRRDIERTPPNTDELLVLTYWFAKAAKSFDAALLLWKSGYWQDAAMLGRTVLEIALQAMYFRKEPEKSAAKILAHRTSQRNIFFKDTVQYTDSDEIKSDIRNFFAEQDLDPDSFKKQRNWWGNQNIWELVKEIRKQEIYVGAEAVYRSQYGPLSTLLHGAPFAMSYYLRQRDSLLVDWRASSPSSALDYELASTVFTSAPTGLLDVIEALAAVWGFDYKEDLFAAREAVKKFNGEDFHNP